MNDSNTLIDVYFENTYSPEARELLYRAIGLFAVFTHAEPLGDIVDLISMEGNLEKDTIVDGVRNIIENGIDEIVRANRIRLQNDVTMTDKVHLLEGIFMLTKVDDPTNLLPLFDGWLTNEEKLAKILGEVLQEEYEQFFYMFTWVYDGTIKRLKEYFETLKIENETLDLEMLRSIRKNLRAFNSVFGEPTMVARLDEINPIKCQPFALYDQLFREEINNPEDIEGMVYSYLWLSLISSDGYMNPTAVLHGYSKDLFTDLQHQQLFDSMLTKALGLYNPTRENQQ